MLFVLAYFPKLAGDTNNKTAQSFYVYGYTRLFVHKHKRHHVGAYTEELQGWNVGLSHLAPSCMVCYSCIVSSAKIVMLGRCYSAALLLFGAWRHTRLIGSLEIVTGDDS